MKRVFCFLFVLLFILLFGQGISFAKEPSFYEEFDQQEELTKQEEKKTAQQDKAQKKVQDDVRSETQGEFFLTDEKHARFLQENEQYALADAMLNQTWKVLTKKLTKKEYRKLWQKHKNWLDFGRNSVADSFKKQVPTIPEYHAFMLATVAKTQELAQSVWHEPVLGRYVKDDVFVTLAKEEDKIFLQGYGNVPFLAKNTDTASNAVKEAAPDTAKDEKAEKTAKAQNAQEKNVSDAEKTAQSNTDTITQTETTKENKTEHQADNQTEKQPEKNILKTMPQLLFRAELPKEGKLWLALTTVNEQKLYLLTTQNSLCIVHAPNTFSFDFNGIFVKK